MIWNKIGKSISLSSLLGLFVETLQTVFQTWNILDKMSKFHILRAL
jgi:hypothetical protein